MPSQDCTADDPSIRRFFGQKGAGLNRYVRARIVILNNEQSLARSSNFSEDFWQTNYGVPLRIDRPMMFKWNSRHMTSFAGETGDHFLRSSSSTNNFHWIWLVFEDPYNRSLFCFGLIRTDL